MADRLHPSGRFLRLAATILSAMALPSSLSAQTTHAAPASGAGSIFAWHPLTTMIVLVAVLGLVAYVLLKLRRPRQRRTDDRPLHAAEASQPPEDQEPQHPQPVDPLPEQAAEEYRKERQGDGKNDPG